MSDPSDTTPLVDPDTPVTTTRTSQPLKWYNYIVLVLFALGLLGALLSSFTSLWKLLFVHATLLLLLKVYHDHHIIPYEPSYDALPKSFLITQVGFAFFLAPVFLVLLAALLFFVLVFTFVIIIMLTHAILSAVYPDAMAALTTDLDSMSSSGPMRMNEFREVAVSSVRNVVGVTATMMNKSEISERVMAVKDAVTGLPSVIAEKVSVPSHVTRAVWGHVQENYGSQHHGATSSPKFDLDTEAFSAGASKIWQDMIDAGANPGVLVTVMILLLIIMFLLFFIIGGIGTNALLELVKFKLFKRHKLLSDPTALRVKGLGYFAITGAFFLAFSSVVSTAYGIVPTFLNCLVFAISALTDVAVLVVSQLLVVAAFSEAFVLQSAQYDALKRAWKTSVLFNFGLALLRVAPAARTDMSGVVVDGQQMTESKLVPSLIALVVFGGARIALLHKFGMPFAVRFKAAVQADEETSQA